MIATHRISQPSPSESIFRSWLVALKEGRSCSQARQTVAERFGLTEYQVQKIEREGFDRHRKSRIA
jgi:hypothetical protein